MLDLSYMIPEESEDNMKVKYPKGIYKDQQTKNPLENYLFVFVRVLVFLGLPIFYYMTYYLNLFRVVPSRL